MIISKNHINNNVLLVYC